jgi:hypothetical protein
LPGLRPGDRRRLPALQRTVALLPVDRHLPAEPAQAGEAAAQQQRPEPEHQAGERDGQAQPKGERED